MSNLIQGTISSIFSSIIQSVAPSAKGLALVAVDVVIAAEQSGAPSDQKKTEALAALEAQAATNKIEAWVVKFFGAALIEGAVAGLQATGFFNILKTSSNP